MMCHLLDQSHVHVCNNRYRQKGNKRNCVELYSTVVKKTAMRGWYPTNVYIILRNNFPSFLLYCKQYYTQILSICIVLT